VAVEEKVVNKDGKIETIAIPVEMPDGVSHEGVFGERDEEAKPMTGNVRAYGGGQKATSLPSVSQPTSTMAPPPPGKPAPMPIKRKIAKYDRDDYGYSQPVISPEKKIDESLKNIADRVKSQGREGNLKLANVEVRKGKVQLILTVTHVSGKMLSKLNAAGFRIVNVSKLQRLVTGVTAVDKIDTIAKLDFVVKIEPMPSFAKSVTLAKGKGSSFANLLHAAGM
jgi:Ca-activated chloride channel family protein